MSTVLGVMHELVEERKRQRLLAQARENIMRYGELLIPGRRKVREDFASERDQNTLRVVCARREERYEALPQYEMEDP